MKNKIQIVTVIAVLTVIGAGALQIGVALATITQPGIQIAFGIAILCAVVMDAAVIHYMGTEPTNRKQFGVGLTMVAVLMIGLILDVVILLTHQSFANETFGWARAFVGVNVAVSLVLAAAFFALSETNTHERQMKSLEQKSEMRQANAFHNSPAAANLYSVTATTKFIERAAESLNIPVSELTKLWTGDAGQVAVKTVAAVTPAPAARVMNADAPEQPFEMQHTAPKPAAVDPLADATPEERELLAAILRRTRGTDPKA